MDPQQLNSLGHNLNGLLKGPSEGSVFGNTFSSVAFDSGASPWT